MDSLMLAGILSLVILALSLVFLTIVRELRKDHLAEKELWMQERSSLLNRLMTKEWTTFAQLEQSQSSPSSDELVRGMSDEEEMARIFGRNVDNAGETLVEFGY